MPTTTPTTTATIVRGWRPVGLDDDDSCRIVDIHLELASDANPVGRLLDARLVLRGLLVPTELGFRPRQHLDTPSPWQILDLGLFRGRMGNQYADYDPRAEQGPDGLQAGSTVYLFRIGRVLPSDALCFLVLRRVRADGGEAVYKRIGLAELFVRQFGQVDVVKEVRSLGEETVVTIV
ncbi:hypothetical protein VTK73DRAFT_5812 [Phialemonium thermophilum]|uniref:Uncharacterized protein n=1 Tax=Phialemonium thermophilum TaxID=223376 RepID=A0ABR3V0F6_9PEZI